MVCFAPVWHYETYQNLPVNNYPPLWRQKKINLEKYDRTTFLTLWQNLLPYIPVVQFSRKSHPTIVSVSFDSSVVICSGAVRQARGSCDQKYKSLPSTGKRRTDWTTSPIIQGVWRFQWHQWDLVHGKNHCFLILTAHRLRELLFTREKTLNIRRKSLEEKL